MSKGEIPDVLKAIWVTPICKGTNREEAVNYRPISITNHLLKIMERSIRQQMSDYLTVTNKISEDQHGARNGWSTITQLLDQHDFVLEQLMEGKNVDCVYLDFAKAYDLVDMSLLLAKVKKMGIGGYVIR